MTVEKAAIDKKGARDAYIIADSDSRYLTDEELSSYTEEQRMLAKNEIYARHGRQFVTEYVSSYFESKPWYQGNISPEEFDREQNRILNPYELANVEKLTDWQH